MMFRKHMMKYMAVCAGVAMMAFAAFTAYAQGSVETGQSASLTMSYNINGTALKGVKAHLYKVASIDELASFKRESAFSGYTGVDLNSLTSAEASRNAAAALVTYVTDNKVTETAEAASDQNGSAAFSSLSTGLYLVISDNITSGSAVYTFQSSLISLPSADNENNSWNYNVTASPKYEKTPKGSSGGGGGNPPTIITNPPTPVGTTTIDSGNVPAGDTIVDENVPLGNVPKTGEVGRKIYAIGLAGALLFILGLILIVSGRKKKYEA